MIDRTCNEGCSPARNRRGVRAALRDRSGAVAILVAICSPVLFLILGIAVDYAWATYVNQRLSRAADASALAAVSQTAATAVGGYGNTSWLQYYGSSLFTENVKQMSLSSVAYSLTVVSDGNGGAIATASYNYAVPAFFAKLIGITTIPVGGTVQASAKPLTYLSYYILVDTSQSMGIGATAADMQNLYDRVVSNNNGSGGETGCVFGCHVAAPANSGGLQKFTNEDLAHNISPRITLRIDSAVTAIQNIVADASSIAGANKNIKFGLYTLQADPTASPPTYYTVVADLTNDYAAVTTSATKIDLGPNTSGGIGDTDYVNEIAAFMGSGKLPSNGNGASATAPLNFVIIITDGVADIKCSAFTGHCTGAFDSSRCDQLKKNATVGVIYTTYLPVYVNNNPSSGLESNYSSLVAPFVNNIPAALQACATSSNYYFEATDGPALNAAMKSLFAKTLPNTARLTQ